MNRIAKQKLQIFIKYIVLSMITIIVVMPFIFMIANSFMDKTEILSNYSNLAKDTYYRTSLIPEKVTLIQYYEVLFRSPTYIRQFFNSVVLTFPALIIQIIVSFIAAYSFAKIKFPGRDIIFIFIIIIMLLPIQVTLIPNYILLRSIDLLNKQLGIVLLSAFAPLGLCLLRQYLRYIPEDAIEAAKIDGASHLKIILTIVMPQAKGGIAAVVILSFIDNWNMVEQPLLLLKDDMLRPLSLLMASFNASSFGIAFAAGVIYMIPALLIFALGQEYIILGINLYGRK